MRLARFIEVLRLELLAGYSATNHVALGVGTAEGEAGDGERIVGVTEEVAGAVADGVEALDRFAVSIKHPPSIAYCS